MNHIKPLLFVSALSGAVLFSTPAAALSNFNGLLSGFQYTLTDLDLTDGIAPSIAFDIPGASLYTNGALGGATADSGTQTTAPGEQQRRADLDDFNRFRSIAFYTGQLGNSDPLTLWPAGIAHVLTNGGLPDSGGTIHASSTATAAYTINFTLSARTKVSFKMDYQMDAWGYANPADGMMDETTMSALLIADCCNNSDQRHANIGTNYLLDHADAVGSLSVETGNYTLSSKSGYFSASIRGDAFDYGPPPAVPEPETWAMLLAGLLGVGFASRRRPV